MCRTMSRGGGRDAITVILSDDIVEEGRKKQVRITQKLTQLLGRKGAEELLSS